MCLNETYIEDRIGRNRSDRFPTQNGMKQGGPLSSLLFKFSSEYTTRNVQLLVYDDDVNILRKNTNATKENTIALVETSRE